MQRLFAHHLVLLAVAATALFALLGGPRLWDRDEPRNAGCAYEMLQRGDWVTPVFNGELRTHKPVLMYWLMMSAYSVLGVGEFAARFWSAALATGAMIAVYHIGRRLFSDTAGLWAGLALGTCLMFDMVGRAATHDAALVFCGALALLIYVVAVFRPGALARDWENGAEDAASPGGAYFPRRWTTIAAMYAVMGVGVLAKGPVGLVLPTAVIGMFLLVMRLPVQPPLPASASRAERVMRWAVTLLRPFDPLHVARTAWSMRPLTALAAAGLVALPWHLWVGFRTDGAWLRGFYLEHNLGRTLYPMEGHHGSVLYYPLGLFVGFFPWSVFAGPVLFDLAARLRRGDAWRPGLVFTLCWAGVYVGLFSLASTKLPSYMAPMYPALALLTGAFLDQWTRGRELVSRLWPRLAWTALAIVGVVLAVVVPLAANVFLPGEEVLGLLALLPIGGAALGALLVEMNRRHLAAGVFAGMATLLAVGLFGVAATRVDRHRHADVLLNAAAEHCSRPELKSLGCLEPSWVFYFRAPIREYQRGQTRQLAELLGENPRAFAIVTADAYGDLAPALPRQVQVLARVPYFLEDEELLLVGRPALETAASDREDKTRR